MLGQLSKPKKLCLLRLSAIGDVCHAVAMVQNIQRQWPKIQITWVIGKIEAKLLQGLPNVEFVIFDKKAGLQGYKNLRQQLHGRKFDVLLHMQVAFRASIASLCIPAKIKIGFDRKRAKELQWLFTNKKIAPQSQAHVLDGFMGFSQALGVETQPPKWQMPISNNELLWAKEKLTTAFIDQNPIVVICPSASKAERNWHPEGYAKTIAYLISKGFNVVLCGGPNSMETLLATSIYALCAKHHQKNNILNLVGQTDLKQLLAILKIANLVIAPDTGPAHMAVTVNTPVIGLYAHSNPMRTGPYLFKHYVVSYYQEAIEKQYNRSITSIPWGKRAKGKNLMMAITFTAVKNTIDKVIAEEKILEHVDF